MENIKSQQTLIDIDVKQNDLVNLFSLKNNKTLKDTLNTKRYQKFRQDITQKYPEYLDWKLGEFLTLLKSQSNEDYKLFLNKYGDAEFCEFEIKEHLDSKGLYCFIVDGGIKYIGRCTDNFAKRINNGYGKIHPKNCFVDGQSTNCHINSKISSKINDSFVVKVGIIKMDDKTTKEIKTYEKKLLSENTFEWNIQKR
jgi:hypothetical protein